ncbi:S53 family peptidase [Paludisphaera rhizosphaerae]|uniref:S53 family peptidase n=1 Tax=Paludisphaera rhizosphaerae TaxID=2711216 RepID=UPI0013E9D4F4|nr:S53 family peptidase [Paludisphaera rhizosphaerae]
MGNTARRRRLRPEFDSLDSRRLLSGFTPSQIQTAYGLSDVALPTSSGGTVVGDGSGQTIAIIGAFHNPTIQSDLDVFDSEYGLPHTTVTVVNLGTSETHSTWASESAMDVQWAHALAPGASIVLIEAASDGADDVLKAVDVARNLPGVSVVSMSFGFTETAGQHAFDGYFTTPAGHTGVTFIAASGDHGPQGGAMYPASSPNVLGVGGTTLTLDAAGDVLSEGLWSLSASGPGRYASRPSYQTSFQQGARRTTPDVVFLGDPNTGVASFYTDPETGQATWRIVAGTSLGAPAWAAIVAMVNQGRALLGAGTLDGASQTLPALYGLNGTGLRVVANSVSATAAGLGAPDGRTLIPALVQGTMPKVETAAAGTTTIAASESTTSTATVGPMRRQLAFRRRQITVKRTVAPTPSRPTRLVRQPLRTRRTAAVA